jgi:hypothetical protein
MFFRSGCVRLFGHFTTYQKEVVAMNNVQEDQVFNALVQLNVASQIVSLLRGEVELLLTQDADKMTKERSARIKHWLQRLDDAVTVIENEITQAL